MIREHTSIQNDERGSALIITLLLVAVLVSLVVGFVYDVHIDTSSFSNWSNAQRATFIARSGQALGSQYLDEVRDAVYSDEREADLEINEDFGPGIELTVKIEDENSKFNINSIIYQNGKTNEAALSSLKKLLVYLNINPDLALLIADWIDPDSEPRRPYSEEMTKDAFLWSADELQLVRGIDTETYEKLASYITVSDRLGRKVNINTAEAPVLVSLHKDMTGVLAKRIIEYREGAPFEEWTHVQRVSGMETIGQEFAGKVSTKSIDFRVTSTATVNEITRTIESIMDTSRKVSFWREG